MVGSKNLAQPYVIARVARRPPIVPFSSPTSTSSRPSLGAILLPHHRSPVDGFGELEQVSPSSWHHAVD